MHVLIIEDENMIAMHVQEYMRDLGFESFSIASGQDEAVKFALQRRPDLIIADFQLEQGTGPEAVKQICKDCLIPTIYVAALPWEVRAADPRAVILEKPFLGPELLSAVRDALSQAQ